jgi:hypothetical protein
MTNSNNLTKAQRRTQARRAQRAREAAVREAELCKTKGREGGNGVKAPDTKVPQAPTFKGGLSAAERLKVRAQRESAEKRKRMRRRQQNHRIFR